MSTTDNSQPETEEQRKQRETNELLRKLEQEYLDSHKACVDLQEQLIELKEKLVRGQEDKFRKYANLTKFKEDLLMNTINMQTQRLQQFQLSNRPTSMPRPTTAAKLETVNEEVIPALE